MKAGGSYAIVFGKKLQTFASELLKIKTPKVFANSKEIYKTGGAQSIAAFAFGTNPAYTIEDLPSPEAPVIITK